MAVGFGSPLSLSICSYCIAVVKENGDGEKHEKIAASEGGLSQNEGQTTLS